MFSYFEVCEGLLEYFEVGNKLVIEFGLPVDFAHGDLSWIEHICELAVDCSGPQMLNFSQVCFEQLVDPVKQLTSGKFDGVIGVYGDFVYH